MAIDLDQMSEKDLKSLRSQVDRALATYSERKLADARRAAEEAVAKYGLSLADLTGGKPARSKGAVKYRNPADAKQTWSGRGRQPGWIKQGLAEGRPMSDFAA